MPDAQTQGKTSNVADKKERKPYVKPALRRLGSVRELTLGGGCRTSPDVRPPLNKRPM